MGAYIEEKKFQIKLVHVICIILLVAILFTIYALTMTNYRYHRRIFGNRYTYSTIEKKNMPRDFQSLLSIVLDSELEIDEEYGGKIDEKELTNSFNDIMDIYLEYLPDDVDFAQGEFSHSNGLHIADDEYNFQLKGEDLRNMIIEILTRIRDDNNFYYFSKALNSYTQLEVINEISSYSEFQAFIDEKVESYTNADFIGNNYQWYQTSFVNQRGEIFLRLLVFSRMEDGEGKTMLFYNGGRFEENESFQYEIRLNGEQEVIKILGDYSQQGKEVSGTGEVYREGEYLKGFDF